MDPLQTACPSWCGKGMNVCGRKECPPPGRTRCWRGCALCDSRCRDFGHPEAGSEPLIASLHPFRHKALGVFFQNASIHDHGWLAQGEPSPAIHVSVHSRRYSFHAARWTPVSPGHLQFITTSTYRRSRCIRLHCSGRLAQTRRLCLRFPNSPTACARETQTSKGMSAPARGLSLKVGGPYTRSIR